MSVKQGLQSISLSIYKLVCWFFIPTIGDLVLSWMPPQTTSPIWGDSGLNAAGTERSVSVGQPGSHTAVIFTDYDKIMTFVSLHLSLQTSINNLYLKYEAEAQKRTGCCLLS